MHISSIKINNYKSFNDSGDISFSKGINLVVGQNSVGKTALLELMSLKFNSVPHRSLLTLPQEDSEIRSHSSQLFTTFVFEKSELIKLLNETKQSFVLPYPDCDSEFAQSNAIADDQEQSRNNLLNWFLDQEKFYFDVVIESASIDGELQTTCRPRNLFALRIPYSVKIEGNNNVNVLSLTAHPGFDGFFQHGIQSRKADSDLFLQLIPTIKDKIYFFKAERICSKPSQGGYKLRLEGDGSNLPQVLGTLHGSNPGKFQQYVDYVRQIFPQIHNVTIKDNSDGSRREVMIWYVNSDTLREDLAVPLSQCGTGIGQVLALLYVITMYKSSEIIIIDELQTFLHSGALRKMVEIMTKQSHHQYIISTHSPIIISTSNPRKVILLELQNSQSICHTFDTSDIKGLHMFMAEIGAKPSDLFGADSILWVEGATEEQCYPLIIEEILKHPLRGKIIRSVVNTGDFDKKKNSKLILELIRKFSSSWNIYPPALGLLLDDEGRIQKDKEDLIRIAAQSKINLQFLKKKMYENYLLNPLAILDVLNSELQEDVKKLTVDDVLGKFKLYKDGGKYDYDPSDSDWTIKIHGGNLLKSLFLELSENKLEYDKVPHGVMLTKWFIKNKPEGLQDIAEQLKNMLDKIIL